MAARKAFDFAFHLFLCALFLLGASLGLEIAANLLHARLNVSSLHPGAVARALLAGLCFSLSGLLLALFSPFRFWELFLAPLLLAVFACLPCGSAVLSEAIPLSLLKFFCFPFAVLVAYFPRFGALREACRGLVWTRRVVTASLLGVALGGFFFAVLAAFRLFHSGSEINAFSSAFLGYLFLGVALVRGSRFGFGIALAGLGVLQLALSLALFRGLDAYLYLSLVTSLPFLLGLLAAEWFRRLRRAAGNPP